MTWLTYFKTEYKFHPKRQWCPRSFSRKITCLDLICSTIQCQIPLWTLVMQPRLLYSINNRGLTLTCLPITIIILSVCTLTPRSGIVSILMERILLLLHFKSLWFSISLMEQTWIFNKSCLKNRLKNPGDSMRLLLQILSDGTRWWKSELFQSGISRWAWGWRWIILNNIILISNVKLLKIRFAEIIKINGNQNKIKHNQIIH